MQEQFFVVLCVFFYVENSSDMTNPVTAN